MPTFIILAQAAAPTAAPVKAPDPGINMMVMMAFAFALIYILSIRPQQKKAKELAAQIASVKTGDRIVTSGGIHGIVANAKEGNTLILKIADNVKIEIDKSAVATIVKTSEPKAEPTPVEIKA